jgi:tetratricopeptide (TPR) repeat protein
MALKSLKSRIYQSFSGTSVRGRIHASVILGLMVGAVIHQLVGGLHDWYIEDAAISFAYSRNLALGEGLVPFIGGERIEGYSNPTWVAMIAMLYPLGIDGFTSSKVLAGIFGALTIPLSYLITREALPDQKGDTALIAPIFLATFPQFAIWNASGLENSAFNFFLAMGIWRSLQEPKSYRWPWSAVWFFLLALTRPDGIMYAALGGFWCMVYNLHGGRGLAPTVKWLATFFIPFTIYHAWRYNYFAWEFPNTYYAKDKQHRIADFNWRGWKYLKRWSHELWQGYFLPIYIIGVVGSRRWRWVGALLISTVLGFILIYPATETLAANDLWPKFPAPTWWNSVRVGSLGLTALLLPIFALGARGWQARAICWGMGCVTVFFSVWAGGDWMKGFRWYSMLSVPASTLIAVGIVEISNLAQRVLAPKQSTWTTPGWLVASVLTTIFVWPNLQHTSWFVEKKETGPFSVKRRVTYTQYVQRRLHLDERAVVWDVDQGAHLYWSDYWMMDMAGLVDVSVAHHHFEKPFMREYLFTEMKPHFAHVHGGWANSSRIPTYPEWKRDYFEIPGYPAGKKNMHIGNHIRRDLIMKDSWSYPTKRFAKFEDGIELFGPFMPSPQVARARSFYLELGLKTRKRTEDELFRVIFFISNGEHTATWDLPPGYDWHFPDQWSPRKIFHGKYARDLTKALEPGRYDLGFILLDNNGEVIPAIPHNPEDDSGSWEKAIVGGSEEHPAYVAAGEVRFPHAFQVVTTETNAKLAREDREKAYEHASMERCREAESFWFMARKHRPKNQAWEDEFSPDIHRALAECWASKAMSNPQDEIEFLKKARERDHNAPGYRRAAKPVADALYEKGLLAKEAKDWEQAYTAFMGALTVDPTRSWARRYAEEARDYRLGIDPETKQKERLEREKRMETLRKRDEPAADPGADPKSPASKNKPLTRPSVEKGAKTPPVRPPRPPVIRGQKARPARPAQPPQNPEEQRPPATP